MSALLATLPVQLACQLLTPGPHGFENITMSVDRPLTKPFRALPAGYTAFPDIGVAMKYFAENLPWNEARKHCIEDGGSLAVIDSLAKAQYANTLRGSNPRGAYLGIHKLFDSAEWVSIKTGLPIPFIPWKKDLDHSPAAKSCTVLWGDFGGRVGAADCNSPGTWTCEVPLL